MLALLVALSLSWSGVAGAQAEPPPSTKERAEELFREGRELMNQQRNDEACRKFTESMDLYPSIGAQLNMGRCFELGGRPASAFAAYKKAASMARRARDGERADAAERYATEIESKLSWITIEAERVPDLTIELDGTRVALGALSTPLPVDPGEHHVTATVPGRKPWSSSVSISAEGESHTVAVPSFGSKAAPPSPDREPPPTGETPPVDKSGPSAFLVSGVALVVVGAAGLIVGAVFGGLAIKDRNAARDDPTLCPNMECGPEGREVVDRATDRANVATVGIVVGAVAAAAGITLIVLSTMEDRETALHVTPAGATLVVGF